MFYLNECIKQKLETDFCFQHNFTSSTVEGVSEGLFEHDFSNKNPLFDFVANYKVTCQYADIQIQCKIFENLC